MKKFLAIAAAATALAIAAPASAQQWQNINQRQAQLDQRIDVGVRNGALTRNEAVRLRAAFNDLARLEARYRATGGLSYSERADLDRRFDALSRRIQVQRHDAQNQGGWNNDGWVSINQRQRQLDARIDAGVRSGALSYREASRLRAEFSQIAHLENSYRNNGLNLAERRDLDRRFDALSARVYAESRDWNNRRHG